jgi:protein tyrosine phosphatase (PTP) superfamily phosphohydrolase (DUF442 family)
MTHAAVILIVALVWGGLYYAHWVLVRRRLVAIVPGRVYQSGAMSPRWLIRCARRYAIDTVIDFRGVDEAGTRSEALALAECGIRHVNIPLETLPNQNDVRCFLEVMTEERSADRRVLMHCRDGEGRAIAMAAIYRIEFEGWSPLQAYRAGKRLPPGLKFVSILFPSAGCLSSRNCKTRFILDYRATRSDSPTSRVASIASTYRCGLGIDAE